MCGSRSQAKTTKLPTRKQNRRSPGCTGGVEFSKFSRIILNQTLADLYSPLSPSTSSSHPAPPHCTAKRLLSCLPVVPGCTCVRVAIASIPRAFSRRCLTVTELFTGCLLRQPPAHARARARTHGCVTKNSTTSRTADSYESPGRTGKVSGHKDRLLLPR